MKGETEHMTLQWNHLFEKGTIALVTGAGSGIGRACALALARQGAYVIVNYGHNKEGAQETLNEILKEGGAGAIVKADVSSREEVESMFAKIMNNFHRLDILVNNSGIIRDGYLLMMSEQSFNDVVNVNLGGCFLCTKAALRIMCTQQRGSIVNISSTSGISGSKGQANYSASKAGIIGFTRTAAKEYADKNIRINAVAPGFIDTKMTNANKGMLSDEYIKYIPMARFGKPEEVANAVVFLASPLAEYITGKVLAVDGGMTY